MRIVRTLEELSFARQEWKLSRARVGLVPTMGYLHEGHVSLMRALRPVCDVLVVSIYVNPLQFAAHEDLDRYPRDPEGDSLRCREAGVDALFMPDKLYPEHFSTSVRVSGLADGLCGGSRPGHFEGMATVVARLFGLVGCDVAIFGEKDFQQLQVIRRFTRDLALPVDVVAGALVRDADGLALSSRNVYLSADERRRALSLPRALHAMRQRYSAGEHDALVLRESALQELMVDRLDYLEVVDVDTLQPLTRVDRPARALIAAWVGKTRLIDNVALS
jgi:pantoate--beta-alanine ligase